MGITSARPRGPNTIRATTPTSRASGAPTPKNDARVTYKAQLSELAPTRTLNIDGRYQLKGSGNYLPPIDWVRHMQAPSSPPAATC